MDGRTVFACLEQLDSPEPSLPPSVSHLLRDDEGGLSLLFIPQIHRSIRVCCDLPACMELAGVSSPVRIRPLERGHDKQHTDGGWRYDRKAATTVGREGMGWSAEFGRNEGVSAYRHQEPLQMRCATLGTTRIPYLGHVRQRIPLSKGVPSLLAVVLFKLSVQEKRESKSMIAIIQFDGGSKPNPGEKYGSYAITLDDTFAIECTRFPLGYGTNNEAEFESLLEALIQLRKSCWRAQVEANTIHVSIFTDSMIVRGWIQRLQAKPRHKPAKNADVRRVVMFGLAGRCFEALKPFKSFTIEWNSRDRNVEKFGH